MSSAALTAAFSWVVFGPLTVVGLALPGAAIVEAMGWWLVNETVLMWRWGWIGLGIWVPLVLITWGVMQNGRTGVWVGQHGVGWRTGLGRWVELPYAEIDDVWTEVGQLVIRTVAGRVHAIPIRDGVPVVHALGQLVARTWGDAQPGDRDEVPEGLRELLAVDRGR